MHASLRDIIEALRLLDTWRAYPEARAQFITFAVGQEADEHMIRLQWTAYIYGWISHKTHAQERQLMTSGEANRQEVSRFQPRS